MTTQGQDNRGRGGIQEKVHCTGRGDDDYDEYDLTQPYSEAPAASSDLEPEIPFVFGTRYAGSPPRLRR